MRQLCGNQVGNLAGKRNTIKAQQKADRDTAVGTIDGRPPAQQPLKIGSKMGKSVTGDKKKV